jgi:hypothetical protein
MRCPDCDGKGKRRYYETVPFNAGGGRVLGNLSTCGLCEGSGKVSPAGTGKDERGQTVHYYKPIK